MVDTDKQLSDLRKEIVEARNLVIKNDNLLKNIHGDVKKVFDKQESIERRARVSSVTAYMLFVALTLLGAYKWESAKGSAVAEELATAQKDRAKAEQSASQMHVAEEASERASKRALEVFERLAGSDADERKHALTELGRIETKKLTPLEQRALEDKASTLRIEAAREEYDSGRNALNRRDWKTAADNLTRYLTDASKVDDQAYLMLGTARHAMKNYKDAVEPLQTFLKNVPGSKQGDFATMLLGEALSESGDVKGSIDVYRNGANRYGASQSAQVMRNRAKRLEHQLKDTDKASAQASSPQ